MLRRGCITHRSRYYDPAVGEFVSEDTIGFAGGNANLSRYVANNPLFYVDPTGLCATPFESDLNIGLNKPVIDLIPDLNFDFPRDDTFEVAVAPAIGGVVVVGAGVVIIGGIIYYTNKTLEQLDSINDDDNLVPGYFESSNPINPPQKRIIKITSLVKNKNGITTN